jgi:hypothetical protein
MSLTPDASIIKLSNVIVEIGKAEYSTIWPTFISDILSEANAESACLYFEMISVFSDEVSKYTEESFMNGRAGEIIAALSLDIGSILAAIEGLLGSGNLSFAKSGLETLR